MEKAGQRSTIDVPLEDYPAYVTLPRFIKPGYLTGVRQERGITFTVAPPVHIAGPTFPEVYKKYPFEYVGTRLVYQPNLFARMLAKIGYGMAVLALGLEGIAEPYVIPNILGKADDVGQWVGCDDGPPLNPTDGLHAVGVWFRNEEILVRIRLFAQFSILEYVVCVGKRTSP
ncbi:MAG: hypothetical protein ABI836_02370 [Gemmatimonadota bacterium]